MFAVLFLALDASFAGYLAGRRIVRRYINMAHSYVGPLGVHGDVLLMAQDNSSESIDRTGMGRTSLRCRVLRGDPGAPVGHN